MRISKTGIANDGRTLRTYFAMLRRARNCYAESRLSVCPSVSP